MDTTSGAKIHHPYWPRDLLIPNYVANDRSMSEILTFLISVCGLFLLVTWLITGSSNRFGIWRRLALCWFAICGFIHCVVEGWFSLYYDVIPGDQSFLSQLCEYIFIDLKDSHTFKKMFHKMLKRKSCTVQHFQIYWGNCHESIYTTQLFKKMFSFLWQGRSTLKETVDMSCKLVFTYVVKCGPCYKKYVE